MGKVYCSSDWHGSWDPAYKVLDFLEPDDKLFYLGDFADRGKDGVKIIQTLMKRPNTNFVLGNHDEFILQNIKNIEKETDEFLDLDPWNISNDLNLWMMNGGGSTFGDISRLSKEERYEIYTFIRNIPLMLYYDSPLGHSVILEHAGYSPFIMPKRTHDSLWDREHFYDDWEDDKTIEIREDGKELTAENTYLVHGHTPTQYLTFDYGYKDQPPLTKEQMKMKNMWYKTDTGNQYIPEVIRYCDGHKFDVDMCTIASGRIALLNLDTFETIYFDKGE